MISLDYKSLKDLTNPDSNNSNTPNDSNITEIDILTETNSTGDFKKINYGKPIESEEQIFSENFYAPVKYEGINFEDSSSSVRISQAQEQEIYLSEEGNHTKNDTASETLSTEEAKAMVLEIQYASILGTLSDLSFVKRQQLANWSAFEKVTLNYLLTNEGITRDVDFSRLV